MLKLRELVSQLNPKDSEMISAELKATRAVKFHTLFNHYRTNGIKDDVVREQLGENHRGFYVLKSRLFDKVQQSLIRNLEDPKSEVLKKMLSIPNLLYRTNRAKAESVLLKFEEELLAYDLPNELTIVYSTLKKIHLNTEKYHHYSSLYNKHIAYMLALDKAQDLMAGFMVHLGEYQASGNENILAMFQPMRDELESVCRLYTSHHLRVYRNIMAVSMALFLHDKLLVKDDAPVEDLLLETENIILSYPLDSTYHYLKTVIYFLFFEYYHSLGQDKKEEQYFDLVNSQLPYFLNFNFYSFPTLFLLSRIEYYVRTGKEEELSKENNVLFSDYEPNRTDFPNYINFVKYHAVSAYYAKEYKHAAKQLYRLINEISFKNLPHYEMEIKILLTLFHVFEGEPDLAGILIKNVARKLTELNKSADYENARLFVRVLNSVLAGNRPRNFEKEVKKQLQRFEAINKGKTKMLGYLKLDDTFVRQLAKPTRY